MILTNEGKSGQFGKPWSYRIIISGMLIDKPMHKWFHIHTELFSSHNFFFAVAMLTFMLSMLLGLKISSLCKRDMVMVRVKENSSCFQGEQPTLPTRWQ